MVKPPSSSVGIQCIGFNLRNSSVLVSPAIGFVGTTSCGIPFSTQRAMMGFTLPEMATPYSLRDIWEKSNDVEGPSNSTLSRITCVTHGNQKVRVTHGRDGNQRVTTLRTRAVRNLKPNQEMTSDSNDAAAPAASEAAAGGVTKTAAKNAKSDAQKYYKKKSDPEGLKKIEQGDEAFK
jgi:hypothetical protein